MSRVGEKPIPIPPGVEVQVNGREVLVKGPKGSLSRAFHPDMTIALQDSQLVISRPSDRGFHRALHGLTRSLLFNMVQGVSQGFQRALEVSGVGYRAHKAGEKLTLQVGFSHPVEFIPPPGITLAVEGTNRIVVQGIDKELVGEVAARIRKIRPCDPYKGKGIKYVGERIRRKAGKARKAIAKK